MGAISKGANALLDLLDMSHDARMARAREIGFDTDRVWYHGTASPLEEFDSDRVGERFAQSLGFHLANTSDEAAMYARGAARKVGAENGGHIGGFVARPENPLIYDIERGGPYTTAAMYADDQHKEIRTLIADAEASSTPYDSVLIRKQMPPDWTQWGEVNENLIALDPSILRSTDAAFDPAKKDSANLLASVAGAGVLGAAALSPEDATAADLVQSTGYTPEPNLLAALDAQTVPGQPSLSGSVGNTLLELAAAANRGVASGVDFVTVDQANALLQLLGSERQLPTLTDTLAPATTGNHLRAGTHRDVTRFLGELASPI